MHTCLWTETPQVSESVIFAEFEQKYNNFLKIETGEWDLKPLIFNYWNDFIIGSVQTCFLKVGAYVSLKQASVGHFVLNLTENVTFFKHKNGQVGPKNSYV